MKKLIRNNIGITYVLLTTVGAVLTGLTLEYIYSILTGVSYQNTGLLNYILQGWFIGIKAIILVPVLVGSEIYYEEMLEQYSKK